MNGAVKEKDNRTKERQMAEEQRRKWTEKRNVELSF